MTIYNPNINLSWETRLCEVGDELGYFHTWEHYSQPVKESLLVGGAPSGVIGRVYGIVEFPNGVRRIEPTRIKFCDEIHSNLCEINQIHEEKKNDDKGN